MLGYMENKTAKRKLERIENPDMDGQSPTGTVGMEKGGSEHGWTEPHGDSVDGERGVRTMRMEKGSQNMNGRAPQGQSGWRRRGQDMDGQYPQHIK